MATRKRTAARSSRGTVRRGTCLKVKHELEKVKRSLRTLRSKHRVRQYGPRENIRARRARMVRRAEQEEESLRSKYNDARRPRRSKGRRRTHPRKTSAYNRFVRAFFRKHPDATMKGAARAWHSSGMRKRGHKRKGKRYGHDSSLRTRKLRANARRYQKFMRKEKRTWHSRPEARARWKRSRKHRRGKGRR